MRECDELSHIVNVMRKQSIRFSGLGAVSVVRVCDVQVMKERGSHSCRNERGSESVCVQSSGSEETRRSHPGGVEAAGLELGGQRALSVGLPIHLPCVPCERVCQSPEGGSLD